MGVPRVLERSYPRWPTRRAGGRRKEASGGWGRRRPVRVSPSDEGIHVGFFLSRFLEVICEGHHNLRPSPRSLVLKYPKSRTESIFLRFLRISSRFRPYLRKSRCIESQMSMQGVRPLPARAVPGPRGLPRYETVASGQKVSRAPCGLVPQRKPKKAPSGNESEFGAEIG
jgi:hypothetical protein